MLFGYTLETIYNVAICPRGYLQADLLSKLPEVTLKYQSSPEVILLYKRLLYKRFLVYQKITPACGI